MKKDLVLLILLIAPAVAPLIQRGYFSMHDDMQSIRQAKMDECLKDGQFPCRWNLDLGYGYGYPLFNYYPPLPYLVGQPFRWAGFQYIDVVKIVGIIGFTLTALFMYLLGKEFWGRLGGFVSALFYTYAPYHSVDFYVRGAMNEFWAMALYPAIFWTSYRLILSSRAESRDPSTLVGMTPWKWITWLSLSVAGLMLSHNPMLMIFAPALVVWCLFWVIKLKAFSAMKALIASALWALGLAAFFTLPVLLETKFVSVWTLTSGYFNYLAHFLDLNQIFFKTNWGYGESVYGPADTMSFALGYLHWIIPAVIAFLFIFVKRLRQYWSLILLLLLFTVTSLFMAHFKATPIWQAVKPLEFLQFPWRFLTLVVFFVSLLSGSAVLIFNRFIVSLLLLLLLLLNANYFRPRQWYPDMTDAQKFSGRSWYLLITSGIFDYLPKWAPFPPADPPGGDLSITGGTYKTLVKKSNLQKYLVEVSDIQSTVEIQTYYFPGWKYWLDGQEVQTYKLDPLLGRPQISVSSGSHELVARLTNTPIRTVGNTLSLLAWVALVGIMIPWRKK